jgi:hypothetical protein
MIAARLKQDGADNFVSEVDTKNIAMGVGNAGQFEPITALGRFNTHDYYATSYRGLRKRFKALGQKSTSQSG